MTIEPHVFESADGQGVEAELGRLAVLENRSNPRGRLIELAFVRFRSTAAEPGPPVVYLAGGPGGSGIATARGPRFHLFMAMREAGDVIALDQRGVGLSKPCLECPQALDYPLDRPGDREAMLALYRERSRACARFWTDQGVELSAYNTNESADDIEALRQALGVETISLWSTSYGTHLALAVIRRHEGSVHRAILAGAEGPDHTLKLPSVVRRQFEAIAQVYKTDPKAGEVVPDLLGLIEALCARLEEQPATVEVTDSPTGQRVPVTVGSFDLQLFAASIPGRIHAIQRFPAAAEAMSRGDFTALAEFALEYRRAPLAPAMSWMMDCASGASDERRAQFEREEKKFPLGGLSDFPYPYVCDAWGSPNLGEAFRAPIQSTVPVLFISGALDGRTPTTNVEEIRGGFPNSAHVVIENTAHGDHLLLSSPETGELMVRFMKGERVPGSRISASPLQFEAVTLPPRHLTRRCPGASDEECG
jgi:pimeloyl-ACP methyl ester carboxylesterase